MSEAMTEIELFSSASKAPAVLQRRHPGADMFILHTVGLGIAGHKALEQMKRAFRGDQCINFVQNSQHFEGKYVLVGHKIDPLIADLRRNTIDERFVGVQPGSQ